MRRGGGNRFLVAASFISLVAACVSATSVHAGTARAGGEAETREAAAAFPDEIRGTVVFNGCVVDPAKVRIRAVPLGVRSRDGFVFPRWRSSIGTARIDATADAHVLKFSIRNLSSRTPYQIGISWPPNPCGTMFWRGPEQGLALTGSRAVKLEGFAAQTQLELFSRETGGFVGADELDFTDPGLSSRSLRWKTLIPGVTGGELQLSTEPFPRQGAFRTCDEPASGVFYRQEVPARPRGKWQALEPIDLGPLLVPAGRIADPIPGLIPISAATHGLLLLGAPVYMRVVPFVGGEQACDTRQHGVAGWVIASKLPKGDFDLPGDPTELPLLIALNGQSYAPPQLFPANLYLGKQAAQGHPKPGELAYRVTKWHVLPPLLPYQMTTKQFFNYSISDPMGMMLLSCNMAKPGAALAPGSWFAYVPKSKGGGSGGFFSGFSSVLGGLATGTWTALGEMANSLAEMTEQIKASLAKAVVNVATIVPGVSEACGALQSATGASCEAVVEAGMEYGLASMGLPPSLPNWEQLQNQGIEYLAAEVATQIGDPTGLSQQFTEQMLHDMVDSTLNKVSEGRPGLGATIDWLTPYLGYDPAVWTLSVFNSDPNYHPQSTYVRVKAGNGLYQEVTVHVPERFPAGGVLRIPVVLQPSTAGIATPRCRYNRFTGTTSCVPKAQLKTPVCESLMTKPDGTNYWAGFDCSWTNWTSIYYRDAWVQEKLNATACVFLGGYSASNAGGLWLTNPNPPFTDLAYLPPLLPAAWDGGVYIDPACP